MPLVYLTPDRIHAGKRPRCTCGASIEPGHAHGVRHLLIDSPRVHAKQRIKRANGKFGDEELNEQWLEALQQGWAAIALLRQDYRALAAHLCCCRMPPAKLARASPCALAMHSAGVNNQPDP